MANAAAAAVAAIVLAGSAPAAWQEPSSAQFEVASIKQKQSDAATFGTTRGTGGACRESIRIDRSRVSIECATLTTLISHAYRFPPARISGPDWMNGPASPKFDIAAKVPEGASENQVPEMLRFLLRSRFALVVHPASSEAPVYGLVVAKSGLKVYEAPREPAVAADAESETASTIDLFGGVPTHTVESAASGASGRTSTFRNPLIGTVLQMDGSNLVQRWEAPAITFEGLAGLLDRVTPLSSPVIDMTGLRGRYRLVLEVSLKEVVGSRPAVPGEPPDLEDASLKAFNDGLRKLGLQLERRKAPVEKLFVEHVSKTPSEN
ncbi:MAG TPA: TIGR03435 family protein [Bryobacteraceae bacterium]|nr:TIGR03435 family protein [Bryobacteraceae bacterium]